MNIAHIVSTFPPYQGGMGNVAAALQRELQALGHTCDVFTPEYDGKSDIAQAGASVYRLKPLFSFGNAACLPRIGGRLNDYDVVHVHYPFFGAAEFVAWHQLRHSRQAFILTYHMDTIGTGWKAGVFAAYRHLVWPFIASQADAITASSLDYAAHSALGGRMGGMQIIDELPFGVDPDFTPLQRGGLWKEGVINLLFVGALDKAHYFKGLPDLFEATKIAGEQGMPLVVTVVGDGDLRTDYESKVSALGLQDRVRFTGRLSRPELVAAYQQADVTVLPSVDQSEAFGLVLIESMACGTPVIASNLPGVRTVLQAGKTGWLCQPRQPQDLSARMVQAWHDRQSLPAMRQAAAERVNTLYRWPAIAKHLEALYDHVRMAKSTR